MTELSKILNYWNKDGLCARDSPTSHADPLFVKIDNYFETRQLNDFIMESSINERALDVGAGRGRLSRVLAEHYTHVVALEGADRVFAVLQKEMKTFDNVAPVHGSFEDLAEKWDDPFDLILASGVLYLYDDEMVDSFLEAVKKNLSPNAVLILRDFIVKGERITRKSVYVQDGNCYYRNRDFWRELADRHRLRMLRCVKSKPDLHFMRKTRMAKTIALLGLAEFISRKIAVEKMYARFIHAPRESFTRENTIYTVFMVMKNA